MICCLRFSQEREPIKLRRYVFPRHSQNGIPLLILLSSTKQRIFIDTMKLSQVERRSRNETQERHILNSQKSNICLIRDFIFKVSSEQTMASPKKDTRDDTQGARRRRDPVPNLKFSDVVSSSLRQRRQNSSAQGGSVPDLTMLEAASCPEILRRGDHVADVTTSDAEIALKTFC